VTRARAIAFSFRLGSGASMRKEIRRYFNTAKRDRGMKWVYGYDSLFGMLLPPGNVKSFAEMAREQEAAS